MEYKTCEEYVIAKLNETEYELETSKEINEFLKMRIEELREDLNYVLSKFEPGISTVGYSACAYEICDKEEYYKLKNIIEKYKED